MVAPMTDLKSHKLADLNVEFGERPSAPRILTATDNHRRQGRKLAAIHRAHLMDMARIARVLSQIETGDVPAEKLAGVVQSLDMTQNYRLFGSLCGQECRMLTFHHDAEEYRLFPELESKGNDALLAVVRRLRDEHKVVHELLERLERASMTMMFGATKARFTETRNIFLQLQSVVKSHFHYEESELEEAIGVHLNGL